MSGTTAGGRKASITNRLKHGEDFYERIGRKGGQNGHTGGFASNHELAKEAGRKGGRVSKRGKQKTPLKQHYVGNKKANLKELIKVLHDLVEEL